MSGWLKVATLLKGEDTMKSNKRQVLIVGDNLVITNILLPEPERRIDIAAVLKEVEVLLRSNIGFGFDNGLQQQFEHAVSEMASNPSLKVGHIAAQLNLSVSTLGRWCYKTYGVSPMKFIYNLRLSRAARLMAQNYGRVKEVAYETGFSSVSYFSKCYKDKFGIPPTLTRSIFVKELAIDERIQLFE